MAVIIPPADPVTDLPDFDELLAPKSWGISIDFSNMEPPLMTSPADHTGKLFDALAERLRSMVEASPNGVVSLDVAALAEGEDLSVADIQAMLCVSARMAGFAVGVVGGDVVDIMTMAAARRVLSSDAEIGTVEWAGQEHSQTDA